MAKRQSDKQTAGQGKPKTSAKQSTKAKAIGRKESPVRATPEEIAAAILDTAKHVKPSKAKFARATKYTEKTMASERYDYNKKCLDGVPIRFFHKPGETVTGVIGKPQQGTMYWMWLYPMVLDDGTLIYLPNNRRLSAAIKKADAQFVRVKVTYEGKLRSNRGHYQKVYSVESKPNRQAGIMPQERSGVRWRKNCDALIAGRGRSRRRAILSARTVAGRFVSSRVKRD